MANIEACLDWTCNVQCVKSASAYNLDIHLKTKVQCDSCFTKSVISDKRVSNRFDCELTLVNDVITNHLTTISDDDLVDDIETSLESSDLLDIEDNKEHTNLPRFDLLTNAHINHSKNDYLKTTSASSNPSENILDVSIASSSTRISSESESSFDSDLDLEELVGDLDQAFSEEDISNIKDHVVTLSGKETITSQSSATIVHELFDDSSEESISPVKEILMYKVLHQRLARGETELPIGPDTTLTYQMTNEEVEKQRRRMKLNRESSKRARHTRKQKEKSIKEVFALRTKEYHKLKKTHEALQQQRNVLQRLLDKHKFCNITKKPP